MEKIKDNFHHLLLALRKCTTDCPWTKSQTIESYSNELLTEAREVIDAIENQDYTNLKEELGDVLWDALMVAHFAEEKGLFKVEDIMHNMVEKIKRRKPYLFNGEQVTIEQAQQIWLEEKKKEKEGK